MGFKRRLCNADGAHIALASARLFGKPPLATARTWRAAALYNSFHTARPNRELHGHEPDTGAPRLRSKKYCQLPASWKAEAIGASMTGAEPVWSRSFLSIIPVGEKGASAVPGAYSPDRLTSSILLRVQ